MDRRQFPALIRSIIYLTLVCGLFAGLHLWLSGLVPGGPTVRAMIFAGSSILIAYVLMLDAVARYALALFLTAICFVAVRYAVVTYVYAGDADAATVALMVTAGLHLLVLVAMISLLDESSLFGTVCPECEARGAVSEEVVDRYREAQGSRTDAVARRVRVTTKHQCRKCDHVWFERAFTFDD